MLIHDAEVHLRGIGIAPTRVSVRLENGLIAEVGDLTPRCNESMIEAHGAMLLPGLHDHHIHLFALAAGLASVRCGPPDINDGNALAAVLHATPPNSDGWVRGIGYHESVAGEIDREWLDRHGPPQPIRIQHRGGRQWIVNSAGLNVLLASRAPPPKSLECRGEVPTGRILDGDEWLRSQLPASRPDLKSVTMILARYGVTGVTDMTPSNDDEFLGYLAAQQATGSFLQSVFVAGRLSLGPAPSPRLVPLATKLHLHEAWLPPIETIVKDIAASHRSRRPVAIHCVTRLELVFALAALRSAGTIPGDRIEHGAVADEDAIAEIAALGLHVVTQPHFIHERGDRYSVDVEVDDRPFLYRAKAFLRVAVPLAAGSDAPFGDPDPWAAMAAATSRRTLAGALIGPAEALSPEQALRLFLAPGDDLTVQRRVEPGAPADVCLLHLDWSRARMRLSHDLVRATWCAGRLVFDSIDQTPC
jgi:predicted amidohydrolase YtcJ